MTAREERGRTTAIYFLLATVIALVGVVLAGWGAITNHNGKQNSATVVSIGASLLAAGLASIGFGILRHFDDRDNAARHQDLQGHRDELGAQIADIGNEVTRFGTEMARSIRMTTSASLRCVSDLEIGERFRMEYDRAARRAAPIPIDVLGLKLHRFLADQLEWIRKSGVDTHIRLLMQHPDSEVFEQICEAEARSLDATRRDMAKALSALRPAEAVGDSLVYLDGPVHIDVRFFPRYQPVTLFRVDSCIGFDGDWSAPASIESR